MGIGVQPSLLLEREDDLARISGSLEQARDGRGTLVMVEGPAGVGKTALLADARAIAESSGMQVLRSRGAELEREFAFGVVRQLLEPVLRGVDDPEGLFQGPAGVTAGLLGLPGAPAHDGAAFADQDSSFAVLHGLYWLCADLAGRQPLCVLVDDAHWADAPSLRFLSFLVPRLEELPVALLVGARPREAREQAALLESLAADAAAQAVTPAPLTAAGVAELLTLELGAAPGPAFADACHRATGGLPFLVRQVVGGLREGGVAPTEAAAPLVERFGGRAVGRWMLVRLDRRAARRRAARSRPRRARDRGPRPGRGPGGGERRRCRRGGGHARGRRHPRPGTPARVRPAHDARGSLRRAVAGRALAGPPGGHAAAARRRHLARAGRRAPAGDRAGRRGVGRRPPGRSRRPGGRQRGARVRHRLPAARARRAAARRSVVPPAAGVRAGRGQRRRAGLARASSGGDHGGPRRSGAGGGGADHHQRPRTKGSPMTKMIVTPAGEYVHPMDYVRRRRWMAITTPHQR